MWIDHPAGVSTPAKYIHISDAPLAANASCHVFFFVLFFFGGLGQPTAQLLPPNSLAERLKQSSEEHGIFVYFGLVNGGAIAILGFLVPFFPEWTTLGVRVAVLGGEVITVSTRQQCVFFFSSWRAPRSRKIPLPSSVLARRVVCPFYSVYPLCYWPLVNSRSLYLNE